jgi:hypothetical protein
MWMCMISASGEGWGGVAGEWGGSLKDSAGYNNRASPVPCAQYLREFGHFVQSI